MSYSTVRAAIVAGIEALTPTTRGRGQGKRYRHIDRKAIEAQTIDRAFQLVAVNRAQRGHAGVSDVIYKTMFQLIIHYEPAEDWESDDVRMGEDFEQLAAYVEGLVSEHADIESVISQGDVRVVASQDEDALTFTFEIRHQ